MINRYAEFYTHIDVPMVGTDGILPIDGRLSYINAIKYVINHPNTKFNRNNYKVMAFRLCRGSILNPVYESDYIVFLNN